MAGSAWTNQLQNLIILSASQSGFSGFFTYSPAPGTGNLIASEAAAGGTDPFGNVYLPGNVGYFNTGSNFVAVQVGTSQEIGFYTAPTEAGPWTQVASITAGPDLVLNSNRWIVCDTPLVPVQSVIAQQPGASIPTLETWHSLGTLAGCSLTQAAYRMTPEGELELDFHGTTGGANAATVTFSVTLPAAYQPTTTNRRQPIHTGRVVTAGETFPFVQVTTGGAVQVNFNAANINVTFDVNCRIRLDGSP